MNFNIEDYNINREVIICKRISISVEHIILNNSCLIKVLFFDSDDVNASSIETKFVLCSGPAYKEWGNDDNYLIDFVCKQLNISIKNV